MSGAIAGLVVIVHAAAGAVTASSTEDLPPAWAGGLALCVYASLATGAALALTARRDVP